MPARANQMQTAAEGKSVGNMFPSQFGELSEKFCNNNNRQNFLVGEKNQNEEQLCSYNEVNLAVGIFGVKPCGDYCVSPQGHF